MNFPPIIYIVNNSEEHVGTFFQAAFYERPKAEQYIKDRHAEDIATQKELAAMMEEEIRAGRYPSNLYDRPEGEFKSSLDLSIEEYAMPV